MDGLGEEEKENRHNDVNREKLDAFEPVAFHDLRQRKLQIHRAAKRIRSKDEHRCDEERDLETRADGDIEAQVHFVFQGRPNGGGVLGRISHEGDHDHADEGLRQAEALARGFN